MPNHVIGLATVADLPAIMAIYQNAVASRHATAELNLNTPEQQQAWFAQHSHQPQRPFYVLKNRVGEVLAWGRFGDYYPQQIYHCSAEISLYVRHDMRGVGMGKVLLQYMLEQAASLGIRTILALIFGHHHASIRLFDGFGFQEWGRLPQICDINGQLADVVILGKAVKY